MLGMQGGMKANNQLHSDRFAPLCGSNPAREPSVHSLRAFRHASMAPTVGWLGSWQGRVS